MNFSFNCGSGFEIHLLIHFTVSQIENFNFNKKIVIFSKYLGVLL